MSLQPPPIDSDILDKSGQIVPVWRRFFVDLTAETFGFAPIDSPFVIRTADASLTDAFNLGTLATGYLKQITVLGIATPTTVTGIPTTDLTGVLQAAQFPALTGDVTTTAGSLATTISATTVTPASYGSSTAIPTFTVNAQGRLTAAGTAAVIAPAGTLTGTTLAANVVTSSLTSVGTLVGGATGAGFTIALTTSTVTGTLADARLSSNVPLLNVANIFTAAQTISGVADFTGLTLIATGTSRPRVEFQNATTGTLGTLYYANDGSFTIRKTLGGNTDLLTLSATGVLSLPNYTAATFVAGDFFLVCNASGVVHRSAIGPLS